MEVAVTSNVGNAVAGLAARAAALRNLRPVLADVAAEIDRITAENLEKSRDVRGVPFAPLAPSTLIGRMKRRKTLFKKAAKGAQPGKQRNAQVLAAARGMRFKPLIDTGRMRNSAKARVDGNNTVRWSVVDYGVPHITGGKSRSGARSRHIYARMASVLDAGKDGSPPKRNFSVFNVIGGKWVIDPKVAAFIVGRISAHITQAGKAKAVAVKT